MTGSRRPGSPTVDAAISATCSSRGWASRSPTSCCRSEEVRFHAPPSLPSCFCCSASAGGVGVGLFLGGGAETEEVDAEDAPTGEGTEDAATPAQGATGDSLVTPANAGTEYVRLRNQFIVPVVRHGSVRSLVILVLTVEVTTGGSDAIFQHEPRLRDSFLRVLFAHANAGGFDGQFTEARGHGAVAVPDCAMPPCRFFWAMWHPRRTDRRYHASGRLMLRAVDGGRSSVSAACFRDVDARGERASFSNASARPRARAASVLTGATSASRPREVAGRARPAGAEAHLPGRGSRRRGAKSPVPALSGAPSLTNPARRSARRAGLPAFPISALSRIDVSQIPWQGDVRYHPPSPAPAP